MKQIEDTKTLHLIPATGRKAIYKTNAERQKAYRERNKISPLSVNLSEEVRAALDNYVFRQQADGDGMTLSQAIEKLIRTQLLRKR